MNKISKLFISLSCALALFSINISAENLVVSSGDINTLTESIIVETVQIAGTINCGDYTITATTLEVTGDATINGNISVASLKLTGGNLQLGSGSILTITDGSTNAITTSGSHCVYGGSVVWNSMASGEEYTLPIGCDEFNGTFSFTPSSTIDSWTFSCVSNSLDIDYDNGDVASYYWSIIPSAASEYNVSLPYSTDLGIDIDDSDEVGVITTKSSSTLWDVSSRSTISSNVVASSSSISGSESEEMYVSLGTLVNKVWLGSAENKSWSDADNWYNGEVPTSSDIIVISSSANTTAKSPYINDSDGLVEVNEVYIKEKAKIYVEGGRLLISGKVVCVNGGLFALKHIPTQYAYVKGDVLESDGSIETEAQSVRVDRYMSSSVYHYLGSAVTNSFTNIGNDFNTLYNYDPYVGSLVEAEDIDVLTEKHGSEVSTTSSNNGFRVKGSLPNTSEPYYYYLDVDNYADRRDFIYNPFSFPIPLNGENAYFEDHNGSYYLRFMVHQNKVGKRVRIVDLETGESFNSGPFDGDISSDVEDSEHKTLILPYEAFFICGTSDQSNENFIIDPQNVDISDYNVDGTPVTTPTVSTDNGFRLVLTTEIDDVDYSYSCEMGIRFNANGSYSLTNRDAITFSNDELNEIYSIKDNYALAVNTYPDVADIEDGTEIPLGFKIIGSTGTITARNLSKVDESLDVYLCDDEDDVEINLRNENSYTFTATAGKTDNGRFYIRLKKPTTEETDPTALDDFTTSNDVRISTSGNNVLVTAKSASIGSDSYVVAYDLSGRQIARQPITSSSTTLSLGNYRGVAVVSATVSSQTTKARVIVK